MTDNERKELLSKAKPILFNTEMVRAILDGRKTVTRRVVKPQPVNVMTEEERRCRALSGADPYGFCVGTMDTEILKKSSYHYGDILYVRETWCGSACKYYYRTDGEEIEIPTLDGNTVTFGKADGLKWKPSIHMPKEAARIFLRVTDVRVERLQDCGNMQSKDEGCNCCSQFARIWDSTIKKSDLAKYGWVANPWVWVIEFDVYKRN